MLLRLWNQWFQGGQVLALLEDHDQWGLALGAEFLSDALVFVVVLVAIVFGCDNLNSLKTKQKMRFTSRRIERMSFSAIDRACWPECFPILPSVHAAASRMFDSFSFSRASFNGSIPLEVMIPRAIYSSNPAINPRVEIPGNLAGPFVSVIYSTRDYSPPALDIIFDSSGDWRAISLMQFAAFFLTTWSCSFRHVSILGNILASTTPSASEELCLDICARQLSTCRFSWSSGWVMRPAMKVTAPASTTFLARFSLCLQISLRQPAAILLSLISGSWTQATR